MAVNWIREGRKLAKAHDLQAIVLVTVGRDGTVTVSSYGEDQPKCRSIGEWAHGLWDHALPKVPFQTVFGWGNGGEPKPLTPEEYERLGTGGRAYADGNGGRPG